MATGDIVVFEEAMAYMFDGGWESTDDIKVAVLDNTTTPTAGDTTPALADYTEVGTAGSYTAGGISIGTWGNLITEASGIVTFDSATNPSWSVNASNDTDAYWGIAYNDTQAGDPCFAYIELGGPVDMSSIPLTITWPVTGLFTITKA